jgi:urease accessory protein
MNSARVTNIEIDRVELDARDRAASEQAAPRSAVAGWLGGLLQATDSFYPTGSYAHSFGLEGLVQEGVIRDRDTLRIFIFQAAIPALRHSDLPIAANAWRAFRDPDWDAIGELNVLSAALKTAREARTASENIGRQRAELAATLRDSELARELIRRSIENNWPITAPVAAALEGREIGAPINAVMTSVYYASVAALLSAAVKILRLGQNSCQGLMTEALSLAPNLIAAAELTTLNDIGWFNPWLDIAAARHEHADARMFIS